jgi:hypothetical protein
MIDAPYQTITFQETITCLEEARKKLRELTKQARRHFFESWRANSADEHKKMNALMEEAFALAQQTIESVSDDMLKVASEQSMTMGSFYHTRGGMPPREYEIYRYLGGARWDFHSRHGFAKRDLVRAKEAMQPYLGEEAITWEQKCKHDEPLRIGWTTPIDKINYVGDEFYVLTLILNKVPEHLQQSHEMMLQKFKAGNKKANRG